MSDRRCGYCREFGHTFPNCRNRLNELDVIKRHVVAERRKINELLISNGYGIGAIVTGYDHQSGDMINCIITPETFESITYYNSIYETRSVKYEKRVMIEIMSYSGMDHTPEYISNYYRRQLRSDLRIKVIPTDIGVDYCTSTIHMNSLKGHPFPESRMYETWMRYTELLAPSFDGEVDEDMVYTNIRVNPRLTKGNSVVKLR